MAHISLNSTKTDGLWIGTSDDRLRKSEAVIALSIARHLPQRCDPFAPDGFCLALIVRPHERGVQGICSEIAFGPLPASSRFAS